MLDIQRFMHIPLYVDAVEVTEENMEEVADWCGGSVRVTEGGRRKRYIQAETIRPVRPRQSQAFVGDRVLKTEHGLKIYTPKAFEKDFIPVDESNPAAVKLLEDIFSEA